MFVTAPLFTAFVLACVVLAISPGPGVIYLVSRTLAAGRRAGLASVAGLALGSLGNAIGASLGLAALFAVSATAFMVVKLLGAGWLIYLGVRTLLGSTAAPEASVRAAAPVRRVLVEAFVVAITNPKTAIFFAAFLPQFMTPGGPVLVQSLALASIFIVIAAVTDTMYVLLVSTAGATLSANLGIRRAGRWLAGSALITLGLVSALSGARATRT